MEGAVNDIEFVADSVVRREGIVGIEVEIDFSRNRFRCIIAQPWDAHIQRRRQFHLNELPILFFEVCDKAIIIIDRRCIEWGLQVIFVQANVTVAKAAVEQATINLQYANVTSPITGVSGKSSVTVGALVTANQADSLVTVQRLDPIYVDLTQSVQDFLRMKEEVASGQIKQVQGSTPVQLKQHWHWQRVALYVDGKQSSG